MLFDSHFTVSHYSSPSNKSEVVQELFDEFASDAVRVYLCLIQAFGAVFCLSIFHDDYDNGAIAGLG